MQRTLLILWLCLAGETALGQVSPSSPEEAPLLEPSDGLTRDFAAGDPGGEQPRAPRIRGRLGELGSRTPVAGEAVLLVETGELTVSDEDGSFEFADVPPGTVHLQVPEGAYLPVDVAIEMPAEGTADVDIQLRLDPDTPFTTTVRGRVGRSDPQRTEVSVEEAKKIPGSGGDPLRVIQNLPGVARPPGLASALVVRGSNPNDSLIRLDGQLLPQLYHFGGVFSVIPADFLDELVFFPGGFSTKYGNATGGLVEVSLAEGRTDVWRGQVDVNVFHAAGFAEGPLGEKTSLSLGVRRSYIDAILPAVIPDDATVSFKTAPVYYDYQAKLEHRFDDHDRIRALVYGSDDQLRLIIEQPADSDPSIKGPASNHSYFHLASVWWEHIFAPELELVSSLAAGQQQISIRLGDVLDLDLDLTRVSWREDITWSASPQFTLLVGLDGEGIPSQIDVSGPLPPAEGEVQQPVGTRDVYTTKRNAFYGRLAIYSEAITRPHEDLILTAGVRYDGYFGDWSAHVVSPRASVRWQVGPTTALKGGAGIYYRQPDFNQLDGTFGNPGLGPERALQTSIGIEQVLYEGLSVDVQGYYKKLSDLVRPTETQIEGAQYDNGGVGRAYGFEVLLRQNVSRWFWGWVSYTFTVAQRKDDEVEGFRSFDFDQTHVLTAVASARLPWDLELSARFRYATGNPQTPVTGAYFDSDAGVYAQIPGSTNSDRLPPFHQLDVRLDKTWLFDRWTLVTYIEVWNTYNRANPEFWDYNYNYTQRQVGSGLPIIPGFGITAKF